MRRSGVFVVKLGLYIAAGPFATGACGKADG